MNNRLTFLSIAGLISLSVATTPVIGATISGQVATKAGEPIAGALVTLWNEKKDQKETVYSDINGHYELNTQFMGEVTLRGRSPYFGDINQQLNLQADTVIAQDFSLHRLTSAEEISASLPASAHASKLPFQDDEIREFTRFQ